MSHFVNKLWSNPEEFVDSGHAIELLELYFDAKSLDSLKQMLKSNCYEVVKVGVWIASELGSRGEEVIDEAVNLITKNDRYLTYHVMDIIAVNAKGTHLSKFMHLIRQLSSHDNVISGYAKRLIPRCTKEQLDYALNSDQIDESNRLVLRELLGISSEENPKNS